MKPLRLVFALSLFAVTADAGRILHPDFYRRPVKTSNPGTVEALDLGDSTADLIYTTLSQPCRIIDTRIAGGPLTSSRNFLVAGSSSLEGQGGNPNGCGIPFGPATAVSINFVAVNAAGGGNLRGSAWPNPVPTTGSIINYQALTPSLNVANGVIFPICDNDSSFSNCPGGYDITIQPNGAAVHLVADVLGYFSAYPTAPDPPSITSESQQNLLYTTLVRPCRIIDTRVADAGGSLIPGVERGFVVASEYGFEGQGGTPGGCGIPENATVAMINFVAVGATGPGNLQGAAYHSAIPTTGSVINYQLLDPPLNIANGLLFPICDRAVAECHTDIRLRANGSEVHVVADVLGYFKKFTDFPAFPPNLQNLTYTTFPRPCRIIDTRSGAGALPPGVPRHFKVSGTLGFEAQGGLAGGCSVPDDATVAFINFVAVNPTGGGNLRGSAFPNELPSTGSVINYQLLDPPLNVANGLLFPLCFADPATCTSDITLGANGAAVHVVADVMGYARRVLPVVEHAIYVSPSDPEAADDPTCGFGPSMVGGGKYPCVTIGYGLSRAAASSRWAVHVAAGFYPESITLLNGISLLGGWDANFFGRDPAAHVTTISGGPVAVSGAAVTNLVFNGFEVRSANATTAGGSSIGIRLMNATGVQVTNNAIQVGNGANGADGPDGLAHSGPAPAGNNGSGGGAGGAQTAGPEYGGKGGDGTLDMGVDGSPGSGGAPGGWGGEPPTIDPGFCASGGPGGTGTGGAVGGNGSSGGGGGSVGNVDASTGAYLPAAGVSGGTGGRGKGGGGGGGGGGGAEESWNGHEMQCFPNGRRGGGGGSGGIGGLGGNPGAAGLGGGASIGILLSGTSGSTVENNTITTGSGGAGGAGGDAAAGQFGGNGGAGGSSSLAGPGGNGGKGGNGGSGGAGGGGGGGPSIGIATRSSSVGMSGNNITLGSGGAGGEGGLAGGVRAGNGQNGTAATVVPIF